MRRAMKKRNVRRNELGRKLVSYSAAAGAALAVGTPAAKATPIYTPANIILSGPSAGTPIDFDGDYVSDLYFVVLSSGASNTAAQFVLPFLAGTLSPLTKTGGYYTGVYPAVRRLEASALISTALFTMTPPAFIIGANYPSLVAPFGNFAGKRGFVGAAFDISGKTHFAWLDIESSADLHQLTIHGWAYESEAGMPIHTIPGQKVRDQQFSLSDNAAWPR